MQRAALLHRRGRSGCTSIAFAPGCCRSSANQRAHCVGSSAAPAPAVMRCTSTAFHTRPNASSRPSGIVKLFTRLRANTCSGTSLQKGGVAITADAAIIMQNKRPQMQCGYYWIKGRLFCIARMNVEITVFLYDRIIERHSEAQKSQRGTEIVSQTTRTTVGGTLPTV